MQRPIWEFKGLVGPASAQHIFSLLSKAQHLHLYLPHLINPLHLANPLQPLNPLQSFNPPIVAKLFVLNARGHQLEERLVRLLIIVWYIP